MSMKRAAIGLRGMALAPVTTDTLISYVTGAGVALPYVGSISRTQKESKQDLYYDDDLYAQVRSVAGEDVEIRLAEVPLSQMATMGLGTYDSDTETLEAGFDIAGKSYALRFVVDTVSKLPFYFNYRVFELSAVKFDNFATKKDSPTVCEVVLTGVFKRPQLASLAAWAVMQLKEDKSNETACTTFLTAIETKP